LASSYSVEVEVNIIIYQDRAADSESHRTMSTITGSASGSCDQTPSLPFSLPASPAPVPETLQHESLSEDGLISDRNLASEDHSLEVGR